MGWCSFNLSEPVKDWFVRQWESNGKYQVVDSALVKRMTMYGAIRNAETGEVFCAVYLIKWSRGYYNFSHKDLTEFSGPCVYDCPIRILKTLSPLNDTNDPNGYARGWREKVIEYHNQRDILKSDVIVKVKEPIRFSNGGMYQIFKKNGRKILAGIIDNECFIPIAPVRINLLNFQFEVI